ncbi:MAG: PDC sensor domain-containing protein [Gammaproteobacteria bacterium]|nr:PDC sensor domain-containing protein [Gammaproteobacteria bacterium]
MNQNNLQDSIRRQREVLAGLLNDEMYKLAKRCAKLIHNRQALEALLVEILPTFSYCKHLYVMDALGQQLTDNITAKGHDAAHFDRNRMDRPYMQDILGSTDFKLSDAYISKNKKRPSLTAIQVIRNEQGQHIGFLGADFDMRELPYTERLYNEPATWQQHKGDPAIRSGLFQQYRVESLMDDRLDEVISIMTELMTTHGIYHGKLHFSSNRATIWQVDDPFVYRLLNIHELTDPATCLAYPRRPYHPRAIVPAEQIQQVFQIFKALRFADENVYLRAGSLNVINGMVGLNFSCDGSHYIPYDEFLQKDTGFWFGSADA